MFFCQQFFLLLFQHAVLCYAQESCVLSTHFIFVFFLLLLQCAFHVSLLCVCLHVRVCVIVDGLVSVVWLLLAFLCMYLNCGCALFHNYPALQLRKIDKLIKMLQQHKKNAAISPDDLEKLLRLSKEREECLRPVKIRITRRDKSVEPTLVPLKCNYFTEKLENELINEVVRTLQMLKHHGKDP